MKMRNPRIDFIKGMLMWCVVYGHTINALLSGTAHAPILLHVFVRTFDMPFFMILSGFFLRKSLEKRNAIDVFTNRLCMILVPIIVWTLLLARVDIFNCYYFLWAVLCSSFVCIFGHALASLLPSNIRGLECIYYIGVTTVFHMFRVPWNMFYLFPFFVVGYYLRAIDFGKRRGCIMVAVFAAGLCFWDTAYTPWKMGALAWRDDPTVLCIYGYRFALGVVGVCAMGIVFDVVWKVCGEDTFFVRVMTNCGRETLALYILQTFCIETVLRFLCEQFWKHWAITVPSSIVNFIGYLIVPTLSFISIWFLYKVINIIKSTKMLNRAFGFKVI